ncbi:MATE family efflux transporter [uncultured Agathobaculum sp.]|uniref:MATE family efflux transporter n=1 Tax=uncultured Agathobaculum sp. TaxID=2048140 RepID=UPI00296E2E1C
MEQNNALAREFHTVSLIKFALPNIGMMIFLSLYTIVDGMFISRLVGTTALSAINMSFPLNSLQMAIGIMLGTGGSAIIARRQGEGRADEARQNFTMLVTVAALVGLCFAVLGNIFLDPILRVLGTSELQWADCRIYTLIQLAFAPMLFLQTSFQTLFVTAGKPGLGLLTSVGGGITNMVLDWLFIGPMNMGVAGAAIATCLGYCVPSVIGLVYFFRNRSGSLFFVPFKFDGATLAAACGNGSSEMVSNIANAVTTFMFNMLFMRYRGEDGVAAITIAMYFQFVFTAVYFGFSMGVAPVISYKFGERNIPQLGRIFRICMTFVLACSLGAYLLSWVTLEPALTLFTPRGSGVYEIAMSGFPIYAVSFLLMGTSIFASSLFTALSDGLVSAIISFSRTLVFLAAMLLLLPLILEELGIWLAVPVAEGLGVMVSVYFLLKGRKKYQY